MRRCAPKGSCNYTGRLPRPAACDRNHHIAAHIIHRFINNYNSKNSTKFFGSTVPLTDSHVEWWHQWSSQLLHFGRHKYSAEADAADSNHSRNLIQNPVMTRCPATFVKLCRNTQQSPRSPSSKGELSQPIQSHAHGELESVQRKVSYEAELLKD